MCMGPYFPYFDPFAPLRRPEFRRGAFLAYQRRYRQ